MEISGNSYRKVLVETFKAFDVFCRSYDIKYYAAYGTLIGSVRHHGLILKIQRIIQIMWKLLSLLKRMYIIVSLSVLASHCAMPSTTSGA